MSRYASVALLWIMGCEADPASFEIVGVPVPDRTTCTFAAAPTSFQSQGFFDVQGGTYLLEANMINNLPPPAEDPAVIAGNREVRGQTNDVTLLGFEACWFGESKQATGPIECEQQPASQRGFFASGGVVAQNGGRTSAGADAVTGAEASALGEQTIVMRFRAVGTLPSGSEVQSQWFNFPISICSGCFGSFCPASSCLRIRQPICLGSSLAPQCEAIPGCT